MVVTSLALQPGEAEGWVSAGGELLQLALDVAGKLAVGFVEGTAQLRKTLAHQAVQQVVRRVAALEGDRHRRAEGKSRTKYEIGTPTSSSDTGGAEEVPARRHLCPKIRRPQDPCQERGATPSDQHSRLALSSALLKPWSASRGSSFSAAGRPLLAALGCPLPTPDSATARPPHLPSLDLHPPSHP